jgi:tetratricopeptide (TPR) repeat protein
MLLLLFFTMLQVPQNAPFYEYYETGVQRFEDKQYQEAIAFLEAATRERPESARSAKKYGIQFIKYFPYHYLAQAYFQMGDELKTRQAIQQAIRYNEIQEPAIQSTLDLITASLDRAQPVANTPEPQTPDLTSVFFAMENGNYELAKALLNNLKRQWPGDQNLEAADSMLEEAVSNREQINQTLRTVERRKEDLLGKARSAEESNELNQALGQYQAVLILEPGNPAASAGLLRVRELLAAEGRSEDDIQQLFLQTEQELKAQREQLRNEEQNNANLRAKNEDLIRQLGNLQQKVNEKPPSTEIRWFLIPTREPLTADISAAITGDTVLEQATLTANGEPIAEYDINGQTTFRTPLIQDFRFESRSVELALTAIDQAENSYRWTYTYYFQFNDDPLLSPDVARIGLLIIGMIFVFFLILRQTRQRIRFRNRFNPYIAGAPILQDDMFYGRRQLLRQILNTLHNNSLMIYGERRIGKTSFLHRLHKHLKEVEDPEYNFYPVFIDLQAVVEEEFFGIIDHEVGDALQELGCTIEPSDSLELNARQLTTRLRNYVKFLREVSPKTPKLVLLLDEVDIMNGFSEKTNQQLRSIFMKSFAQYLVAVMAGIHINTTWKSEGSPWYNFFEQLELHPFDSVNAKDLITNPVRGVYQYESEAIERIIELSDGKPYLIQKLCVNLVAHALNEGRRSIRKDDVDFVFKEIKSELWSVG